MTQVNTKLKLPADWQVVKLGEITRIRTGEKDVNEGNPYGIYPFFTCSKEITCSDSYSFDTEAILIAGNGEVGDTKYYKGKFEAYQRTYVLDEFKKDPRYLYYFLTGQIKQRLALAKSGSTMPYIRKGDLQSFEVLIPADEKEQQKIVKILDTIQEAIEVQDKIIELTKELKKSVMADLFKYGAPSFRKGRKLKKTEIGEIPESWEVKELGELGELKDGDWILNRDYAESGVRLIQIGDVGIGKFEINSNRFITENRAQELGCTFLMPGQILISRMPDPIGRACIVPDLKEKMITAVDISIMTPNIKKIDKNFLVQFLNSEFFFSQCRQLAAGATRQRISRRNLEKTHIPSPSLVEQQEIAEILQTIDQKIEIEQKKKELYEELFRTMLNKLMTAEIRVKDVEFK